MPAKPYAAISISTHAPAGGATNRFYDYLNTGMLFLLTPLREGRRSQRLVRRYLPDFYSRPCGRGDRAGQGDGEPCSPISTHAPAGGATYPMFGDSCIVQISTHAPAGGATLIAPHVGNKRRIDFYSRPCGRGDVFAGIGGYMAEDFYSRPCGRGDGIAASRTFPPSFHFYSRPCGRGDARNANADQPCTHFYSRPCGRGDA